METLNNLVELKKGYNASVSDCVNIITAVIRNNNIVELKLVRSVLNKDTAYIAIKRISLFSYTVEITINGNTDITRLNDYIMRLILKHEDNTLDWYDYLFINYFNL